MPTAIMAGATTSREPVISATIKMTAMGAREMLPKQAIMPDDHEGGRVVGNAGGEGLEEAPDPGTEKAPDDEAGPEDAPRASRADGQPGGQDAGEGKQEHDDERHVEKAGASERQLDPAVTGAQDLGDGQGQGADEQPADGRLHVAVDGQAVEEAGDAVEAAGVEETDESAHDPDGGEPHELERCEVVGAGVAEDGGISLESSEDGVGDARGHDGGEKGLDLDVVAVDDLGRQHRSRRGGP